MTTAQAGPPPVDPLENVKIPGISFKDQPVGTKYVGEVLSWPVMAQSLNYETGKPDFWPPSDEEKARGITVGNPKMALVFQIRVTDGPREEEIGEVRSVWAGKPSDLFTKIAMAQREFGRRIEPGGTISIAHTDNEPSSNKKFNDKKLYTVEYVGPDEKPVEDPLGMDDFKSPAGSI